MAFDFSKLRVMVAEDSAHMRMLTRRLLESYGITDLILLADGSTALQAMPASVPDILIADYAMEPMDGLALTKAVRLGPDSPNPYMPIIMMTAYTEHHRVVAARDAGVTEIVAKPLSVASLLSRLVAVVERPRPFIRVVGYFGPDRRRRQVAYPGPDRRRSGKAGSELDIDFD
jgi:CheY-like chemotaxis protein